MDSQSGMTILASSLRIDALEDHNAEMIRLLKRILKESDSLLLIARYELLAEIKKVLMIDD